MTPEQRARLPGPVQVAFDMKFEARDDANKKMIEDHFRQLEVARQAIPLLQQIFELREIEPKIPTSMILRERSEPRETFVHKRGDFLDPGPKVNGDVPAVLPPLAKASDQATRLDFARWLVSAENPLTPRVAMNRDWQKFFGRGLVETEDDFGTQGTPPTHPELLDWLAIEFVDRSWDVKRMHRRIVTSSTYRQSSQARSDLAAADPQNKLLGRQSRLRLDAEIVRDVALAASGLLTRRLGGPSVFPPQPEGVFDFTQDPKPWKAATGGDRYRRGMYTHFWRSSALSDAAGLRRPQRQRHLHAPHPQQHAAAVAHAGQRPGVFRVRPGHGGTGFPRRAAESRRPRPPRLPPVPRPRTDCCRS